MIKTKTLIMVSQEGREEEQCMYRSIKQQRDQDPEKSWRRVSGREKRGCEPLASNFAPSA